MQCFSLLICRDQDFDRNMLDFFDPDKSSVNSSSKMRQISRARNAVLSLLYICRDQDFDRNMDIFIALMWQLEI